MTKNESNGSVTAMSNQPDREQVKQLVRESAFDTGKTCPTCQGSGSVPGGRRIIHSFAGGFGADWDEADVLDAIDRAVVVTWVEHMLRHDLQVAVDGRVLHFEVKRPVRAGGAA